MCIRTYVPFFFSSRRRHTRYWRDWSSDVCSSDLERSLLRLELVEVAEEIALEDLRVERGHAVHAVAADDGQVGHPHALLAVLLDDGHALRRRVGPPPAPDLGQEPRVDLVDDLQMPGQHQSEHAGRPVPARPTTGACSPSGCRTPGWACRTAWPARRACPPRPG